MSISGAGGLGF